jgi:hypothetical protein
VLCPSWLACASTDAPPFGVPSQFTLRVSFTYRADDGAEAGAEPAGKGGPDDGGLKTFVFDTKVYLGRVEP